jgi:hypothetical protein
VHGLRTLLDFGESFFLDCGDNHLDTLTASRFENQKRKLSVAGNQSISTL